MDEKIILAADERTAAKFNRLAQENCIEQKLVEPGTALAHHDALFYWGDRVQFFRTHENVRDGELGSIVIIDRRTRTLAVALDGKEVHSSQMAFISLEEYQDIRLGYATTFDRAPLLKLDRAMVLADTERPMADIVNSLHIQRVGIYADRITAARQFPQLLETPAQQQIEIDPKADPLHEFQKER
jgi:hypothetical protein